MERIVCPWDKVDIEGHPAGRCLDQWVHTAVMGGTIPSQGEMLACAEEVWARQPLCQYFIDLGGFSWSHDTGFVPSVPSYSTKIADAWKVMEKIWLLEPNVFLYRGGLVFVEDRRLLTHRRVEGETVPLQICRAGILLTAQRGDTN